MDQEYVRLFTMGELFSEADGWKCSTQTCEGLSSTIALTKRDLVQVAHAVPQEVMVWENGAAIAGPVSSGYIITQQLGQVVCEKCAPRIDASAQAAVLQELIDAGDIVPGVQPSLSGTSIAVVECPACHQIVGDEAPVRPGDQADTWVITCTHCRHNWAARKGDFRERDPRPRNPFVPIKIVGD